MTLYSGHLIDFYFRADRYEIMGIYTRLLFQGKSLRNYEHIYKTFPNLFLEGAVKNRPQNTKYPLHCVTSEDC